MNGLGDINSLMNYFMLFVAVYVLYYAIRGQGRVYDNDYPKAMKEAHTKFLRKFCWIIGLGMLPLVILEMVYPTVGIFAWANIGYVLGLVIVYVIMFRIKFGKYVYPQKPTK